MKIGVISDTHSAGSGRDLPEPVLDGLRDADLILHCGDLECLGVLDYLETVAPVLAVRGYEDPTEAGERLALHKPEWSPWEGVNIGMMHDIQWPSTGISDERRRHDAGLPRRRRSRHAGEERFRERVDVLLFGDTHEELICQYGGVLFMNPGSPYLPGPAPLPRGPWGRWECWRLTKGRCTHGL